MASQHPTGTGEGAELGRFLRARRTRSSPQRAGLTIGTGLRRTPGLRREELATLAGISIDYYVRLERGKETRPSHAVLEDIGAFVEPGGPTARKFFNALIVRSTSFLRL